MRLHILTLMAATATALCLTSCSDDDPATPDGYTEIPVAEVLPFVMTPRYQYWDGIADRGNRTYVLDSVRDVAETFTDEELDESPEYLTVDFDRYTLLVQYHVMSTQVKDHRYYFYRDLNDDTDAYELCVGYVHGDNLTEGEILVDRIAVTVDKLPAGARVKWAQSIIEPK